jgi:hypothetical protein
MINVVRPLQNDEALGLLLDDAKHGAALRQEGVISAPVPTRGPWWLNAVTAAA